MTDTATETDDEYRTDQTITVHVWTFDSRRNKPDDPSTLDTADADTYELPVVQPGGINRPMLSRIRRDDREVLTDDIYDNKYYAFNIEPTDNEIWLNVHYNDSAHGREDWSDAIERGLDFEANHDYPPFVCKLQGRVMMWASPPRQ